MTWRDQRQNFISVTIGSVIARCNCIHKIDHIKLWISSLCCVSMWFLKKKLCLNAFWQIGQTLDVLNDGEVELGTGWISSDIPVGDDNNGADIDWGDFKLSDEMGVVTDSVTRDKVVSSRFWVSPRGKKDISSSGLPAANPLVRVFCANKDVRCCGGTVWAFSGVLPNPCELWWIWVTFNGEFWAADDPWLGDGASAVEEWAREKESTRCRAIGISALLANKVWSLACAVVAEEEEKEEEEEVTLTKYLLGDSLTRW